ncbi:MAG: hypothetical protein ORN54_05320 [Cyclobacteriaceae bacterium]|nr:hypothetical protein [Cyclobacteriaceae bacterium]
MVIHNNFQDFVLFLYIYMALADNYLHPSEEEVILGKMSKLFPTETNPKQKLDAASSHYKTLAHDEVMDIIRNTFKQFNHIKFAQKYKVYTDMYDVINADGKVGEAEKIALDALKEIIDLNSEVRN